MDTCKTCRWFEPKDETSPMNLCKRFPPVAIPMSLDPDSMKIEIHFSFAVVSGNKACGEHTPRNEG